MQSQDLQKYEMPDSPGVYFFKKGQKILYIGKATSLRERVRSYFSSDLAETRGAQIIRMIEEADGLEWQETDSALEAIILESSLIRKHKPYYNSLGKDDKSFNHVVITKEKFPRVLLVRGKDLAEIEQGAMVQKLTKRDIGTVFGPFTSGGSLKEALKLIRKIFPFRDKCVPRTLLEILEVRPLVKPLVKDDLQTKRSTLNANRYAPCFNAQLGLCPGVCTGTVTSKDYKRNIEHIKQFFRGQKKQIVRDLTRDMKVFARQEKFEMAGELKRQLGAISHIQDIALLKRGEFDTGSSLEEKSFRIEAYDIAHTSGKETVGVMVVVENGQANKQEYRMFKIRSKTGGSDTGALKETLQRRFEHDEWPMPRLIVMDGGNPQVNVARSILKQQFQEVGLPEIYPEVVGVVKDDRHRPSSYIGDNALVSKYERAILLANSEAHRFALNYHKKLRGKIMRG